MKSVQGPDVASDPDPEVAVVASTNHDALYKHQIILHDFLLFTHRGPVRREKTWPHVERQGKSRLQQRVLLSGNDRCACVRGWSWREEVRSHAWCGQECGVEEQLASRQTVRRQSCLVGQHVLHQHVAWRSQTSLVLEQSRSRRRRGRQTGRHRTKHTRTLIEQVRRWVSHR